ncbi:hypothetical protein [Kluyvera intermedia]|uniref:hypothetical protein n=1 Tax=Kluyvera intermedia TaxID=61648 RepID=UPI00372D1BA2
MKTGYISYFEGYDVDGRMIFNGNGSCSVDYDAVEGIDPHELHISHCEHLLKVAQAKNANVVRVAINNMMKL